jgi:hypothetical protein
MVPYGRQWKNMASEAGRIRSSLAAALTDRLRPSSLYITLLSGESVIYSFILALRSFWCAAALAFIMAALLAAPPRTPSPKVRIRSQSFSFDSPSSITRLHASTPIEESPFSKSTGSININKAVPQHHVLLPLRKKMSEDSLSDSSSAMSISTASSPTRSEHETSLHGTPSDAEAAEHEVTDHLMDLPAGNLLGLFENAHKPRPSDALNSHPPRTPSPLSSRSTQSPAKRPRLSPPALHLPAPDLTLTGPVSPFAFQDPGSSMTSPWLVRVVLDLHDVKGVCWMDIPTIVEGVYGVRTGSEEVLGILAGNGRVRRRWWD